MRVLEQISANENLVAPLNELFEAVAAASDFGVDHANTSGLVFGFYGARRIVNGVLQETARGTILLTAEATNYIEYVDSTGVVSKNTSGFSANQEPMYVAVTNASGITTLTDHRPTTRRSFGRISIAIGGGAADKTLTMLEARARIIDLTGVLGQAETITVPTIIRDWIFTNSTTGAFNLTVKTSAGTGVIVPSGSSYNLFCDGTNVVRVT